MDWDRKEVVNFDYYMDKIRKQLATATGQYVAPPPIDPKEWKHRSAADDARYARHLERQKIKNALQQSNEP
jgi:hypothetical protein